MVVDPDLTQLENPDVKNRRHKHYWLHPGETIHQESFNTLHFLKSFFNYLHLLYGFDQNEGLGVLV